VPTVPLWRRPPRPEGSAARWRGLHPRDAIYPVRRFGRGLVRPDGPV